MNNINLMWNGKLSKWQNKRGSEVISEHKKRNEANKKGISLSKKDKVELVRFTKKGTIRKGDSGKLSYGNDPRNISG